MTYEPALPFDDRRHLAAHHFLVEEAAILDAGDWARWLELLTDDVRYVMPVRVTTVHDAGYDRARRDGPLRRGPLRASRSGSQRLLTDHAWTEDPPSRTRHLVTNVRTFAGDDGDDRRRVDGAAVPQPGRRPRRRVGVRPAARRVATRTADGVLRLADRHITVEESVLRTQNLAIFL